MIIPGAGSVSAPGYLTDTRPTTQVAAKMVYLTHLPVDNDAAEVRQRRRFRTTRVIPWS